MTNFQNSEDVVFLEFMKDLNPPNKVVKLVPPIIPGNLGRMQHTTDHSEEIQYLMSPSKLESSRKLHSKSVEKTMPSKFKSSSHNSIPKRISRNSPGIVRVRAKDKEPLFFRMEKPSYFINSLLIRRKRSPADRKLSPIEGHTSSHMGAFVNGEKHGKGCTEWSNGDWVKGIWEEGNIEGNGTFYSKKHEFTFKGRWSKGEIYGRGMVKFKNGDKMDCMIKKGILYNPVTIEYINKNIYKGELVDGMLKGQGEMEYPNGIVYKGNWQTNRREGIGVLYKSNEFFFEGFFSYDSTDGPGVMVHRSLSKTPSKFNQFELGDLSRFNHFQQLHIKKEDYIALSLCAKKWKYPCKDGKFKANKLEGLGVVKYGVHGSYKGTFLHGQRHGWGEMTYIGDYWDEKEGVYEGEWKHDCRHGNGVMKWADGTIYEGLFRHDKRHRVMGKLMLTTGDVYEGGWVSGLMHGNSVFSIGDITFKGCFSLGTPSVEGIVEYPDKTYQGSVKGFKPHGHGNMAFHDGAHYEGAFQEGLMNGVGTMKYANGDVYEGRWLNDSRHGQGACSYANGSKYIGDWAQDLRDGFGEMLDSQGLVIYSGNWLNDIQNGSGIFND